ncbi:hypothetical protein AAY473_016001 [Plecturocebus cupreus]
MSKSVPSKGLKTVFSEWSPQQHGRLNASSSSLALLVSVTQRTNLVVLKLGCPWRDWATPADGVSLPSPRLECSAMISTHCNTSWVQAILPPQPPKTEFHHAGKTGLELLTSNDPPASASQRTGITDLGPQAREGPHLENSCYRWVSIWGVALLSGQNGLKERNYPRKVGNGARRKEGNNRQQRLPEGGGKEEGED